MEDKNESVSVKEQLGTFIIYVSKVLFAGVVLSVILEVGKSKFMIPVLGFIATVIFAILGFLLLKNKK